MKDSAPGSDRPHGPAYIVRRLRSRRVVVSDRSMEPALHDGDRLLIDPAAYKEREPKVGDLVVFPDPRETRRLLVKRVALVAGARAFITRDGVVPVAPGSSLEGTPPEGSIEGLTVPVGELFVLADRREDGRDSRQFGPVRVERLLGVAWYRTAPSERSGPLG
ncbi:MAG: signal peptidase I [Thermoplasmata archaeon]|nr:signal peptidase I [Thermoplasmata archaeon]